MEDFSSVSHSLLDQDHYLLVFYWLHALPDVVIMFTGTRCVCVLWFWNGLLFICRSAERVYIQNRGKGSFLGQKCILKKRERLKHVSVWLAEMETYKIYSRNIIFPFSMEILYYIQCKRQLNEQKQAN